MYKVIDNGPFFNGTDEPSVRILDVGASAGLAKHAADSEIIRFASQIKPKPGKTYAHVLALGAYEAFGANKNLDAFPEDNLLASHKTFEKSGHLFRHHINKNPEIAMGKVVFSVYNPRMRRVEIIVEIDDVKGQDIVAKLNKGEYPSTSMGCRTPYDVCSICGNKAQTRQQYCTHLRNELGVVYPDGRRVMAMNVAPLTFHDISYVFVPADPTSSFLGKIASTEDAIVGSAERAEQEGFTEDGKKSSLRKLSELIKEIDGGHLVDASPALDNIMGKVTDPDISVIPSLSTFPLRDVLTTMAHMGISPSVPFLAELISHNMYGEKGRGLGAELPKSLDTNTQFSAPFMGVAGEDGRPVREVVILLSSSLGGSSLLPEFVEKRASMVPGTNVGYIGNGPGIEPTVMELAKRWPQPEKSPEKGLIEKVIELGAAALAAKWYISSVINEQLRQVPPQQEVKIVLAKQASDYKPAYSLSMYDLRKSVKRYV